MELYSVTECAAKAGLRPVSIRVAITEGRLRAKKVGAQWVVEAGDIEDFIAQERRAGRKKTPAPHPDEEG